MTDGTLEPGGCLVCDSSKSASIWTLVSTSQSKVFTFEAASDDWTYDNSDPALGWQRHNKRAANGSYSLYYGNPTTGTYDNGVVNSGTATSPAIALSADKKAGAYFMVYLDIEVGNSIMDALKLQVIVGTNASTVWEKDVGQQPYLRQWIPIAVDLSAYAGSTIQLRFDFNTSDKVSNLGEGVYIDDFTIYYDCTSPTAPTTDAGI